MAGTEKSDGPLFAPPNKLPEEGGGAPKSEPVAGGFENRPPLPPAVTLSLPNNPPVGGVAPEPNSEVPPPTLPPKRDLLGGAAVPYVLPFSVLAGLFAEKSPNF